MAGQYVNLRFEYKKYGEDEDSPEQVISFEGHNGWQMMQFHKQPPTEKQVKLLAELARILNELASDAVSYEQKPVKEWVEADSLPADYLVEGKLATWDATIQQWREIHSALEKGKEDDQ